jgi:hypothetical protein
MTSSLRYLDEFLGLDSAPLLTQHKLFPNAKGICLHVFLLRFCVICVY